MVKPFTLCLSDGRPSPCHIVPHRDFIALATKSSW